MNEATLKVINEIASDILVLAHLILENDSISLNRKVNKNTLRDSALRKDLETKIESTDNPVIIKAFFNNYVTFLEWDRPKNYGKQPPLDSLRDWALSRNIPTDNSTLFLIARAIQRDGHKGRPIIATLEKEIEENFEKETFEKLFNAIIDELIKFFN